MAKVIMIQGTMSNAGKSLLVAGLCRILKQDGYRVAPFKSQNMALNSYITSEGLEMGRAQVMQAEAAGIEPSVLMNPILLKPTSDMGSQVIVNGEVLENMSARTYFQYKKKLIPEIMRAFETLDKNYDVIVVEGAGSPAEINLKSEDIVNMGLAKLLKAPVVLVGDIDRGGVFAQLAGTMQLLESDEQQMVKGLIINKFRGDKRILDPGIELLKKYTDVPVVGVVPYMQVDIDDEDSLAERLEQGDNAKSLQGCADNCSDINTGTAVDIAVIRLPHLSNFTDFNALSRIPSVRLRYVEKVRDLGQPDMVIVPGTKNTMGDLKWLRSCGLESAIHKLAASGTLLMGICGGFQMLGESLEDPENVEAGGSLRGMGLLPTRTVFEGEKVRKRVEGYLGEMVGAWENLSGTRYEGYEIHMGRTVRTDKVSGEVGEQEIISTRKKDNVCGTYVHGIFDTYEMQEALLKTLCQRRGIEPTDLTAIDEKSYKEQQYDKLAQTLRESMDLSAIYEILEKGIEPDFSVTQTEKQENASLESVGLEHVLPKDIENRSFEIITQELGERQFDPLQAPIIKRVIHTSADFDYADNLCFSDGAVEKALKALKNGACIVTDTQMGRAGINKKVLAKYGGEVFCFMSDEDVALTAKKNGTTRAVAAMEKAAAMGKPMIFAIGNAPTALVALYQMMKEGRVEPILIIGVPVGFVNVVQAKELIMTTKTPYIVAKGRKGGSNVAAAICNALLYMLDGSR